MGGRTVLLAAMIVFGNDLQHAGTTGLLSSGYGNAGAFFVTEDNLWQAAIRLLCPPPHQADMAQRPRPVPATLRSRSPTTSSPIA